VIFCGFEVAQASLGKMFTHYYKGHAMARTVTPITY
jgi:hypothetical protein